MLPLVARSSSEREGAPRSSRFVRGRRFNDGAWLASPTLLDTMAANIADRLERVARRHVEAALPPDPSGELAAMGLAKLLMIYGNWRGRFVPQRPRKVHVSDELEAEIAGHPRWSAAAQTVFEEIRAGADLTPRLSTNVDVAYVPEADRKTGGGLDVDLDAALAHNGLHHLHLGHDEGGQFVSRSDDLMFAAFRDEDAYIVGVYPHGAWGRRELLQRIVRNWTTADLLLKADGVVGLSQDYTDEERWQLMKAGVTVLIEIDGAVYAPLGQTAGRTPMEVTQRVNALMWELRYVREQGIDERLRLRGVDHRQFWNPVVRDEHLGLQSRLGFVALGRLA